MKMLPGVLKAVANINDIIAPKLIGMKVTEQAARSGEDETRSSMRTARLEIAFPNKP